MGIRDLPQGAGEFRIITETESLPSTPRQAITKICRATSEGSVYWENSNILLTAPRGMFTLRINESATSIPYSRSTMRTPQTQSERKQTIPQAAINAPHLSSA